MFSDLRARIQSDIAMGLPAHLRRMGMTSDQLRDLQRDRLRRLLGVAMQRSSFHARRLRGIDAAGFELDDLPSLPIMTKTQLMDHFDELASDPQLTRQAAERALAATQAEPQPLPGGYLCMVTGGSSGQRGIFAYDPAGIAELVSLTFRTRLAALGLSTAAGSVRLPEVVLAVVGAERATHGTMFLPSMLTGGPIKFAHLPVTRPIAEIAGRLSQMQAQGLFGYPSMLARLAGEQQAGRLSITPRLVICTAETLQPAFRAAIKEAFGAPIFNTFGCAEGLVGSSGPDDHAITLATDSCIVELVDTDYQPVPPGTASAKVLITNLFNYLQPLIRYELNDSFTRQPDAAAYGHLRVTIQGRADDILRYGQAEIHPLALQWILLDQPDVLDYQVRQTARGLAVQVVLQRGTSLEGLREQLSAALTRAGLADPEVTVDPVATLPRNPETGKLRRVIPA